MFSVTLLWSSYGTDLQLNKKIKSTFAVDWLCKMTTRSVSSCGRKSYCDGTTNAEVETNRNKLFMVEDIDTYRRKYNRSK